MVSGRRRHAGDPGPLRAPRGLWRDRRRWWPPRREAALRAGLEPIVCVGETLEQRKAGEALEVVTGQVRGSLPAELAGKAFSVAYEPVWAIGTGLTPTTPEIEEVHRGHSRDPGGDVRRRADARRRSSTAAR